VQVEGRPLFKIIIMIEKDGDRFYAHCPALKGLHVDGTTREEAIQNAKNAIEAYIASLIKHNEPIPLKPLEDELKSKEKRLPIISRLFHFKHHFVEYVPATV
jgi:predicted RNase H-like HicB family nuclease